MRVSIPSQTLTWVHRVGNFNNCRTLPQAPGGQHKHDRPPTPHRLLSNPTHANLSPTTTCGTTRDKTIREKATHQPIFTPRALIKHAIVPVVHKFEHYANPMVHPVTGEKISSYKKLMNDPATAEVWQTTFGKDFGGMAQGNNKTGQKGTDAMFVMTHEDIKHALRAGKKSLTAIQLLITARKRRIPIGYG